MNLENQIMTLMKDAMKAKNEADLRGLRAIKAEIIKTKTEPGFSGEMTPETEIKMLQKLLKQRQDSLQIFQTQNRPDLAQKEQEEITLIQKFMPVQLSDDAILTELKALQTELNLTQKTEVGKLIGAANKKLAGKAPGATIAKLAQSLF
ncbi:MAG: GatB/YqeY domain-containing protein [Alphaproteobacteria bacterium]|nr:GatB/YqeY domain-containing protein [Alphaproteobacteria bacterium]